MFGWRSYVGCTWIRFIKSYPGRHRSWGHSSRQLQKMSNGSALKTFRRNSPKGNSVAAAWTSDLTVLIASTDMKMNWPNITRRINKYAFDSQELKKYDLAEMLFFFLGLANSPGVKKMARGELARKKKQTLASWMHIICVALQLPWRVLAMFTDHLHLKWSSRVLNILLFDILNIKKKSKFMSVNSCKHQVHILDMPPCSRYVHKCDTKYFF